MPKVETVYCPSCHLATPKCGDRCVHCQASTKEEVIQFKPRQLSFDFTA